MSEEEVAAVISIVYGLSRVRGADMGDPGPRRANWSRRGEEPVVQPSWRGRSGHDLERRSYHRA
ncbi:hypothetical protein [Nocardiopsis halotolerans]|uniref:hypothetical protein n=1 Tax=Nocardiopsis halotolerans TaxID=124252 RepID=UPI000348F676|nr:hypothetical protein [Nocardiopsis halotolerans]